MNARDFALQSMRKAESVGVEGYFLAKTITNFDKPLAAKIHAGKKKTFIDEAVTGKKHVPDANYNVLIDWTSSKKSNFARDMRHTLATDIERHAKRTTKPEPSTYSPKHALVEPRMTGAFNLKSNR